MPSIIKPVQSTGRFMQLILRCLMAAVVSGIASALLLAWLVLLLSGQAPALAK